MRRREKMRLVLLGGMAAGAAGSFWLLDVLEAAIRWALIHWYGMDWGRAAARAPALSGLGLCALFGLGLYLYCRWEENRQYERAAARRRRAISGTAHQRSPK